MATKLHHLLSILLVYNLPIDCRDRQHRIAYKQLRLKPASYPHSPPTQLESPYITGPLCVAVMVTMTGRAFMRRLDRTCRLLAKTKQRLDLNFNKNYVKKAVTYAERKARCEKWMERKIDVKVDLKGIRAEIMTRAEEMAKKHGNTKEYWYNQIMQESRLAQSERKVSTWNAFQSMRLSQVNAGMPVISQYSCTLQLRSLTPSSHFQNYPKGKQRRGLMTQFFQPRLKESGRRCQPMRRLR